MHNSQPVFYYTKDRLPVKAGGILFYYVDNDYETIKLLMIKNRGKYEDFGGKTDNKDKNFKHTVAREVYEESNGIFKKGDILDKIKNIIPLYKETSKYILYFLELNEMIDVKQFGDHEICEGIPRTVEWIDIDSLKDSEFIKNKLNFRLKFKEFFKHLKDIEKKYIPEFSFILPS